MLWGVVLEAEEAETQMDQERAVVEPVDLELEQDTQLLRTLFTQSRLEQVERVV